jgi:hypothetical protein
VQPVRDTSQIDNIKNIQDLTDFYLTLEEWLKMKMQITDNDLTYNLRKNEINNSNLSNVKIDYNEFCDYYNKLITEKPINN